MAAISEFQMAVTLLDMQFVKLMAAILKPNMAAPDVNSQIAKIFLDIENVQVGIDTCILVLGAIEQEIWAKLWSYWHHIGNQYGVHQGSRLFGVYFYDIYLGSIEHQSFMLWESNKAREKELEVRRNANATMDVRSS